MDILGIGITEIIVILLVSVIFLGPARMVQVASKMGFYWRTAQKFLREAADAATVNLDITEPEVELESAVALLIITIPFPPSPPEPFPPSPSPSVPAAPGPPPLTSP